MVGTGLGLINSQSDTQIMQALAAVRAQISVRREWFV